MSVRDEADKKHGGAHKYDPNFSGPVRKRSCTDPICTLLFFLMLVAWAAVAAYAFVYGDPAVLIHPTDSFGRRCGHDSPVKSRPFLLYFDISQCVSPSALVSGCPSPQVCVSQCPSENYYASLQARALCTPQLRQKLVCRVGVNPMNDSRSCAELISSEDCASYTLRSLPLLGRCIPNLFPEDVSSDGVVTDEKGARIKDVKSLYAGAERVSLLVRIKDFGAEAVRDYERSWWVILTALICCMVVSFLWIVLMRFMTGVMVWTALLGTLAAITYGAYYTFIRYQRLASVVGSDAKINPLDAFTKGFDSFLELRQTWLIFFIVLCVLGVVLLLVVIVLFKRLRLAVEMIDQAGRSISTNWVSLLFPLLPWILQLSAMCVFLTLALSIGSMGEKRHSVVNLPSSCEARCPSVSLNSSCVPDTFEKICRVQCPEAECRFIEYKKFALIPYFQAYNLFAALWTVFFLSAYGQMVLAGVFSSWYWTFDKKSRNLSSTPLLDSMGRTFRYHLGTVAFGSLIITVVRCIRIVLDYIHKKCKSYPNSGLARAVLCCCKCCMWVLERFLRFVNRNAYIMCAIYGKNFCSSARKAFFLILRNILRLVAVDAVCDFIMFLGKIVITSGITIGSFYFLDNRIPIAGIENYVPATHYSWLPVVTIAVGCYFIVSLFFTVYSMSVDTLFLCLLEDLERNDGSQERPFYMSKDMMRIIGKNNRKNRRVD